MLGPLHLDLPQQEAAKEFAADRARKALIGVGTVGGPRKRWRRERRHYRHAR